MLSNPIILGAVGDSRNTWYVPGTPTNSKQSNQLATWLEFHSGGRFKLLPQYMMSVGGTLVTDVPGQVANLLAVSPRCTACLIVTGTNTFNGQSQTALQAWTTLSGAIQTLVNSKVIPIVVCDLPRQQSTFSPGASAGLESCRFNQLIKQNAPFLGALVVDVTALLADATSSTGDILAIYSDDGIHENPKGAFVTGLYIANLFTAFGKPVSSFASQRDSYDATHNPSGNLISSSMGMMQGSGGTNSGTGASGTVPTGWKNHLNGGTGTAVASVVARTDGGPGNWFHIDIASTGASAMDVRMELGSQITTNFAAGDQIYMEADMQVISGVTVNAARCGLTAYATGLVKVSEGLYSALSSSPVQTLPDGNYSGKLITPPLTVDGTVVQINPVFFFGTPAAGGSLSARIGSVVVRKVV